MKNRLFYLIFTGAVLALCLSLSVGTLLFGPSEAAANERLTEMPQLKTEAGSFNAQYLSQLQSYVNDRFFLRQKLITLDHRISNLLGVSGEDTVIAGREGWLFFSETLDHYTGTNLMSGRELFSAASNVALMEEYCRSNGKEFTFVVAPNKNSLYGEYMPDYGVTARTSNAAVFHDLLDQMQIPYVDLFAAFGEMEEPLYFAHDSHWNSKGAALGADLINRSFHVDSNFFGGDFSGKEAHEGDLYAMVFPGDPDPEMNPVYGGTLDFTFTGKATQPDAIVLNTEGTGSGALLCYRDSFGILLFPYLAHSYDSAKFSRAVRYDMTADADYVVIELVERNLVYLIQNVPVMPSPVRSMELPHTVSGTAQIQRDEKASASAGCVQLSGQLPVSGDADTCVYVVCDGTVYEAFCLENDGFAVNVAASAAPQYLIYNIGGVPTMFEIQ